MTPAYSPIDDMPQARQHRLFFHPANLLLFVFVICMGAMITFQYSEDFLAYASADVNSKVTSSYLDEMRKEGIRRVTLTSHENESFIYRPDTPATLLVEYEEDGSTYELSEKLLHESDTRAALAILGDQVRYRSNRVDMKSAAHQKTAEMVAARSLRMVQAYRYRTAPIPK